MGETTRTDYGYPDIERSQENTNSRSSGLSKLNPIKLVGFGLLGAALGIGAYVFYESLEPEVKEAIIRRFRRSTLNFLQQVLDLEPLPESKESPKPAQALPYTET